MRVNGELSQKSQRELLLKIYLNGIIKDITSNCHSILGYYKEEIIGQRLEDLFSSDFNYILDKNTDFDTTEINIRTINNKNLYMSLSREFIKEGNIDMVYLSMINITKYKQQLNKANKIIGILERSSDLIFSYSVEGEYRFDYISSSIYENLGYTVEEHDKNPMLPLEIVHPDDYELYLKKLAGEADYNLPFEIRYRHKNGEYIWFEEYITPVYNEYGKLISIEGIARNIQKRKELERRLIYLSYHDHLTGVYNRYFFEKEKQRLNNEENIRVSIIICDLDDLKGINDSFGHSEGDESIKRAAELIKSSVSNKDIVARLGGDEFAIILKNIEHKEVDNTIRSIRRSIKEYNLQKPKIPIDISIGYDYTKNSKDCMEKLFRTADKSMYEDKRRKRAV